MELTEQTRNELAEKWAQWHVAEARRSREYHFALAVQRLAGSYLMREAAS